MNKGSVTIFAEDKLYPIKTGYENFTFCPVLIIDGAVSNRKEPDIYAKAKPRKTIQQERS